MLRDTVVANGRLFGIEGSPTRRLMAVDLNARATAAEGGRTWTLPIGDPHALYFDGRDPGTIWVYDFQSGDFVSFALGPSIKERTRFALPPGLFQPMWVADRVVTNGLFATELVKSFTRTGGALEPDKTWGQSPFPDVLPEVAMHLNRSSIAIDPGRRRLVLAFRYASRLEVLALDGTADRAISGPEEIKIAYRTVPDPREGIERFIRTAETRFGYVDVVADQDRIYALFSGRSRGQWKADAYLADRLHVFSWSGELLGQWQLPEPVYRIALDSTARALYGVRPPPGAALIELSSTGLAGVQPRLGF
jgi:hypothetical protein